MVRGGTVSRPESPAEGSLGYIKIWPRRLQDVSAFISHLKNNAGSVIKAVSSFSAVVCCLLGEDQCIPVRAGGVLAVRRQDQSLTKQGQIAAREAQRV